MNANTVAALITRTVTGMDRNNNDIYGDSVHAFPAVFWPDSTGESTNTGQDQASWQASVCLPDGVEVTAVDAVIPQALVDAKGDLVLDDDGAPQGERYEVDGPATVWPRTPWGWRPEFPVQLKLVRTSG